MSDPVHALEKIRLVIADDHNLVREALSQLLSSSPFLEVCGQASSADEVPEVLAAAKPDVLILDLFLKNTDGIELVRKIHAEFSGVRILVMSGHDEQLYARRVLRAGAHGYIMKDALGTDLLGAVRTVHAGDIHVSPNVRQILLQQAVNPSLSGDEEIGNLTDRELQIFRMIGQGLGTRQVAEELKISPKTVEVHRENIKRKLGLADANALNHRAFIWTHRPV